MSGAVTAGPSEVCPHPRGNADESTPVDDVPPGAPNAVRLALRITKNTYDKYVPAPLADAICADQIGMLQRFRSTVRARAERINLRK